MAKIRGAVVVNTVHCKGCGICVQTCPQEVLQHSAEVNLKGYNFAFMSQPDKCTGCANCATVCPDTVITVYRKKYDN